MHRYNQFSLLSPPWLTEHGPGQGEELCVGGSDGPAPWAGLHLCVQAIPHITWDKKWIMNKIIYKNFTPDTLQL